MKLVFLGPPGSGKGTQAKILSENMNIVHISTGEIFRQQITENTDYGIMINQYLKKGCLVPDNITNKIVENKINEKGSTRGFILDGYPRTINQAGFLESIATIDFVINFIISKKTTIARILKRKDLDREKRNDDMEEVIEKRLKEYNFKTKPLIDYYEKKSILINLDGEGTIEDISKKIQEKISHS